jgi:hypothetical protein
LRIKAGGMAAGRGMYRTAIGLFETGLDEMKRDSLGIMQSNSPLFSLVTLYLVTGNVAGARESLQKYDNVLNAYAERLIGAALNKDWQSVGEVMPIVLGPSSDVSLIRAWNEIPEKMKG